MNTQNAVRGDSHLGHSGTLGQQEGLQALMELALDLRWSWNHAADHLWAQLDPRTWQLTHNPWVILQTVARPVLESALADAAFRRELACLLQAKRRAATAPGWFQQFQQEAVRGLSCIAYFSMEFMLSEALPIYSGGLGNVAGDLLKAASDLGVPLVGVGLLYQQGYFRQVIDKEGAQRALYPYNDPGLLPITPVRRADGSWLRLEVSLPGRPLWLRAWEVQVGRCKLYLLDSNDPANYPAHRGITSELYGGGPELRLQQEMILGLGGWRLLRAVGLRPEVCHLNEGHAAFAVLERARWFMEETRQPFDVALAATRPGNLFTTHTAVPAGFDRFPPELIEQYLGRVATTLGIPMRDLLALGRASADDATEPFNMAYLAIRGSGAVNGVSQLHGSVSRRLFQPLFPRWPQDEVPVGHVTNGVHVPSWDSAEADALWTRTCGQARWLGTHETLEKSISRASDEELWTLRNTARRDLIDYARQRSAEELAVAGAPQAEVDAAANVFDAETLTLGFARRFAAYKRPNLLLHDADRLLRLLTNPQRPVQLIIAGKAHPSDAAGQAMVRQWVQFLRRPEARPHVIFLSDYDMLLAERLVQGADVWVNSPRRPWEASGTSGMKVLVNGGLNLSELDGWWSEAYAADVGWAIGDRAEHADELRYDANEAEHLYDILEHDVVSAFYDRDEGSVPTRWVARVRQSMARLTPQFSADRAIREYVGRYYIPAAVAVEGRTIDGGAAARELVARERRVREGWSALRFGCVTSTMSGGEYAFEAELYLGGLGAEDVRVELYADAGSGGEPPSRQVAACVTQPTTAAHPARYRAAALAVRPAADFTFRVSPHHPGLQVPLELADILWHR